jgi:hypothetical protein
MLLKEWWAWWNALKALHAQEMLDQRRVLVVADAGWQFPQGQREQELKDWQKDALGANGWLLHQDDTDDIDRRDLRREVRSWFAWLRGKFWGDPWRTTGFEEDRSDRQ